ncbi:hypothetical protein [Streptomyces cucumeris]|uniref:hypothetical protein n=1 Tax=Streptomyces cucumeris TaxID=2962890 RepID=UPI003D72434B
MSQIEPTSVGGRIADVIGDGVTFTIVTARLTAASAAMADLSQAVTGAYDYVEGCATSVDRLADTAASLNVDADVIAAHRDAAAVMRSVLDEAEGLATEAAEMSGDFRQAADGHEADYGPVAAAMQTGDAEVADRTYYSNR